MEIVSFFSFLIFLAFLIGIFMGIIYLQIKLSSQENKWAGLIFPILTFLYAAFMVLGFMAYDELTGLGGNIFNLLVTLVLSNIPTWILLIIYFISRANRKQKNQLNKMKIEDL